MVIALPPAVRDFEIHRLACVEFVSTRRIAAKFGISQTRVRQIIEAVSRWVAETLPMRTEEEVERDRRLALHLGAAQLQHQLEQLAELWHKTSDPKFLRQQTRCILAMARLGVVAGAIDGLAAEAEEAEEAEGKAESGKPRAKAESGKRKAEVGQSEIRNPRSEIASAPPVGACSAGAAVSAEVALEDDSSVDVNQLAVDDSDGGLIPEDADLEDLKVIEQHLLSLLRETPASDGWQRDGLKMALAECRERRDAFRKPQAESGKPRMALVSAVDGHLPSGLAS